jgi:hypothetical protein
MDQLHYSFLAAAVNLQDPNRNKELLSMYTVGAQIGVTSSTALTEITNRFLKEGYLRQAPGTGDIGRFKLTHKGRRVVLNRRRGF